MQLTDSQRELVERYRDINVNYEWWDATYEAFAERMIEKGIEPKDIQFRGFWSQGDGASFTGGINLKEFLRAHNLEQTYVGATFFAEKGEIHVNLYRTPSHYCHENTIDISINDDILNDYDQDDLRCSVYETMADQYYEEYKDLEESIIVICRNYMRELYRDLEREYEYLTSDESVWETIQMNELQEELNHQNDEVLTD